MSLRLANGQDVQEELSISLTPARYLGTHSLQLGILATAVAAGYMERSAISHLVPFMMREGTFDYTGMGYVLAAFGFGYVVGLPFSGTLIRRVGHRRLLCMMSVLWTIAAILFATSTTLAGLISARFLLGLAEAPLFPLFVSWIGAHSSRSMVSFKVGLVEAASYLGMALSGPIAIFLASRIGWQWAYLVIGSVGFMVFALSMFLEPVNGPEPEPASGISSGADFVKQNYRLFATVALWAAGFAGYNMCKTFYSTWMPTVLVEDRGWTSSEVASLTFIQSLIAPAFSIALGLCSALLLRRGLSLVKSRLIPMMLGFSLGASIVLSLLFPEASIALLLTISFVGLISTSSLIWSTPNDISSSPRQVAYISGYLNAVANVGSILSPIIVGMLMAWPAGRHLIFGAVGATCIIAATAFALGYFILPGTPPRTAVNDLGGKRSPADRESAHHLPATSRLTRLAAALRGRIE